MSNLSEEEKKAIEFSEELHEVVKKAMEVKYRDNELKALQTIIKKQQKEIEEYKNAIDNKEFTWKQKYEETFEYVKENYINKDKIREKIEELIKEGDYRTSDNLEGRIHFHKEPTDYKIEVLNELLEESE